MIISLPPGEMYGSLGNLEITLEMQLMSGVFHGPRGKPMVWCGYWVIEGETNGLVWLLGYYPGNEGETGETNGLVWLWVITLEMRVKSSKCH